MPNTSAQNSSLFQEHQVACKKPGSGKFAKPSLRLAARFIKPDVTIIMKLIAGNDETVRDMHCLNQKNVLGLQKCALKESNESKSKRE